MQAILAYYLYSTSGGLGMDQAQATALVGAYGSLLYLCTFVGGWVSDRLLGAERTLLAGASLLMCGHLSLSFVPGMAGLVAGLLPLALGSGLLKTAAITILGAAFPPTAGARDGAFQIFYLGINIGALLGPMLTGWLAQKHGYHAGFLAAAGLMCCGVCLLRVIAPAGSHGVRHPASQPYCRARQGRGGSCGGCSGQRRGRGDGSTRQAGYAFALCDVRGRSHPLRQHAAIPAGQRAGAEAGSGVYPALFLLDGLLDSPAADLRGASRVLGSTCRPHGRRV
ncbi:oligopeptide:H+ symporter [Corynebacterium sp. LaCa7]|uniref:oligopeptide:H+ symporter n=1 Tax=Corynebacterium sp. LaCa7 TaxID=3391429 RepID=UPI003988FEF3